MGGEDFGKAREDGKVSVIRNALESPTDAGEDFVAVEEPLEIQIGLFIGGTASSLAIGTAKEFGLTLLGLVRDDRFNDHSGGHRIDRTTVAAS